MSSQDVAIQSDSDTELTDKGLPTMIERTVKGSCHCKKITYEVTIPIPVRPRLPIATRCNCTICIKSGFTSIYVPDPSRDFVLLTPTSGLSALPDYQFNSKDIHRHFCDKCGVTVLGRGFYEYEGQKTDFFAINAGTIDQPQEGIELSAFKMEYWDGRGDAWQRGKKDSPYEGGLV